MQEIMFLVYFVYLLKISFAVRDYVYFGGLFETFEYDKVTASFSPNTIGNQHLASYLMALKDIESQHRLLKNITVYIFVSYSQDSSAYMTAEGSLSLYWNDILIGPSGNSAVKTSTSVLDIVDIAQIGFHSSASDLDDKFTYPKFVRICTSEVMEGLALANFIYDKFEWKRVITFSTTDNYGSDLHSKFTTIAEAKGLEILASYTFYQGHTDFTTIINSAKNKAAFIFVLLISSTDASAKLLEQGYNLGLFHEGTQILGSAKVAVAATWQAMSNNVDVSKIMKGFMGVESTFSFSATATGRSFVKRWRAQTATAGTLPDGTEYCSSDVDDQGWSYYQSTSYSFCSGLNFTEFAVDGSDIDPSVAYVYDATFAAAHAFDYLINTERLNEFSATKIVETFINNVSFESLTGLVSFSSGTGEDVRGRGDRETDVSYALINFNPSLYVSKGNSTGFQTIAQYNTRSGMQSCITCASIIYNTEDNTKPLDRPAETLITLSISSLNFLVALAAILLLILVCFTGMTIVYRKNRIIRASQPMMLNLILFGGFIGVARVIVSSTDFLSDSKCIFLSWFVHLAFGYSFSALIVKTWVINKIVNSKLKKVKISIKDALINVAIVMIIMKVFLFLNTFVGKPHVATILTDDITEPLRYYYCANTNTSISSILLVIEGLSLLVAIRLGWAIRNVPDALNESKYIIAAVLAVIFVGIIVLGIEQLSSLNVLQKAYAVDVGIAITLILVILTLFGPKAYLLWIGAEFDGQLKMVKATAVVEVAPSNKYKAIDDDEDDDDTPLFSVLAATHTLRNGSKDGNKNLASTQITIGKKTIESAEKKAMAAKEKEEIGKKHVTEWTAALHAIETDNLKSVIDMSVSSIVYENKRPNDKSRWSSSSGRNSSVPTI